jgi:hypothetical protein
VTPSAILENRTREDLSKHRDCNKLLCYPYAGELLSFSGSFYDFRRMDRLCQLRPVLEEQGELEMICMEDVRV